MIDRFTEFVLCEHTVLLDILYDVSFQIPERYVEECGEFRRRARRRRGIQRQVITGSKKSGWDMMICGDMEESDESETRHDERDGQDM